eukprot:TRINITY_DN715_c0_g1_i4.p1 TRINITY_DN715_c0_g1~~TRINITY_DN715_c0_g1_i4.p1  ORF type:complete len:577 (+),score=128.09 TRINITY_DN715_c0_g1_i4:96-1733(+)
MSFLFCSVWAVGATIDEEGRENFNNFCREVMSETNQYKIKTPFPGGSVYEYTIDLDTMKWVAWKSRLKSSFKIPEKMSIQKIVVPTVDVVRYSWLLERYIEHRINCLFVGPTGTGKSCYVTSKINEMCTSGDYMPIFITMSAQTTANQTMGLVDEKLGKRKKGHYGPPMGSRCIIFVDDLNMPAREEYGAQPPIELLRQSIDQGGWYDTNDCHFRNLCDIQYVAAMGPPGGGRNPITDRFLRHMATCSITPFADETLELIFTTIMDWHLDKDFTQGVKVLSQKLVQATLELYRTAIKNLLPTPAKSHYTFNLRDFSKIIQGVCMSKAAIYDTPDKFVRLWVHEAFRVFADRLIDDTDVGSFLEWTRDMTEKHFKLKFDQVFKRIDTNGDGEVNTPDEIRSLMFGFYMDKKGQIYDEVQDLQEMRLRWEGFLEEFNQISRKPMKIVLFQYALEHASRIARVLRQPGGNVMLVGVGGSGKQSLSRLGSYACGYDVESIELTKTYSVENWHEDLVRILTKAGTGSTPLVFLLTDTQKKEKVPTAWPLV